MSIVSSFYGSTVGKKMVMAATGLIMWAFVIGHMIGNLKLYAGLNPLTSHFVIDEYGHHLRVFLEEFVGPYTFLWATRLTLFCAVVLHAVSAIQLAAVNRRARSSNYKVREFRSANAASRTMFYGGLFLAFFIVFHILHMTTGDVHFHGFVEGHVYGNLYAAFRDPVLVAFYVLAMAALAAHLYHGTWSMFQTLGVDTPVWNSGLRSLAKVVAVALFVGFSSVPIGIFSGYVPAPSTFAFKDLVTH